MIDFVSEFKSMYVEVLQYFWPSLVYLKDLYFLSHFQKAYF